MLHIRHARVDDIGFLRELYLNHITQNPPKDPSDLSLWSDLLETLVKNADYHLLVGEVSNKVIASVTLVVIRNLTHNLRPYALIENVVTHSAYRKKGYASALMARADAMAREQDCYKIMLMTGSKSENIFQFYERCGFNKKDKTAFIKWL